MKACGLVGRSRKTDRDGDGPREQRVLLEDGSVVWVEEGSLRWEEAVAADNERREAKRVPRPR